MDVQGNIPISPFQQSVIFNDHSSDRSFEKFGVVRPPFFGLPVGSLNLVGFCGHLGQGECLPPSILSGYLWRAKPIPWEYLWHPDKTAFGTVSPPQTCSRSPALGSDAHECDRPGSLYGTSFLCSTTGTLHYNVLRMLLFVSHYFFLNSSIKCL